MSVSSRRFEAPESDRMKQIVRKVHRSASTASTSDRNSNGFIVTHPPAWHRKCGSTFRHEAVTRAHLPLHLPGGCFLRRDDLLKPDVMSEVIVLGMGALVFAILILILILVLTQASAQI
jgi:hypothetical protein